MKKEFILTQRNRINKIFGFINIGKIFDETGSIIVHKGKDQYELTIYEKDFPTKKGDKIKVTIETIEEIEE